jgi:PIN domain nuclease of toxin-antitoxin system
MTVVETVRRSGFRELLITFRHAEVASSLPLHHRDPFDRMLIAQAMCEGLTLVTRNRSFAPYGIPVIQA